MQNLYSHDELIQQIKNCGQSIIDNAESILGDERYFIKVNVSFDILRFKVQTPNIEIKREFTPEKDFEDELTYKELKQRKEIKNGRSK